ncbi:hypothetical protein A2U01_0116043, partial [Trifolium medium]|nr:hypothetical protein [Trifolium medium]
MRAAPSRVARCAVKFRRNISFCQLRVAQDSVARRVVESGNTKKLS